MDIVIYGYNDIGYGEIGYGDNLAINPVSPPLSLYPICTLHIVTDY